MVESLKRWGSDRIAEEGFYLEKNLDSHQVGIYLFAFMSDWQLQVSEHGMKKSGY
jgi:hypothetical protein